MKKNSKISLLCTKSGLKSASLKLVAQGLSAKLGAKVFRTTEIKPHKKQFRYGDCVDKLTQYRWFDQNGIMGLEYTVNDVEAKEWLNNGITVFGRKLLNASCGKGIVVMEKPEEFVKCPVYTAYKKKKREFRVHIFKQSVVTIVEKKRKKDYDGQQDTKIRNLANGYVFVQDTGPIPEGVNELALAASNVCSSDFRGVDIGYNEKLNELFVIEVNSAPGITGSNVDKYVEEILKYA